MPAKFWVSENRGESSELMNLRACVIPFNKRNPYQRLLSDGLTSSGIEVDHFQTLKEFFSKNNKDTARGIIHLHWLPATSRGWKDGLRCHLFLFRLSGLKRQGFRIVWTIHNLVSHESNCPQRERWFAREVLRRSSKAIVHSESAVSLVSEDFGEEHSQKLKVIPHGNYLSCYKNSITGEGAREELAIPKTATVFLFFGYLRPYKGVTQLVDAFNALADPESFLIIAGKPVNPAYEKELRQQCESNPGIKLHLDSIHEDSIQNFMNAADVVVLPYQQILTSGALILAMSFAKACIAPKIGAIPETLDGEKGGFLYEPEDPSGLEDALTRAKNSKEKLTQIGDRNRVRAEKWDWKEIGQKTADLYRETLCS